MMPNLPHLVIDQVTGEAVEFPNRREAMADAESRKLSVLRPDLPGNYQGGPRFLVYPSRGCNALDMVNLRRTEYRMAPLASLLRRKGYSGGNY